MRPPANVQPAADRFARLLKRLSKQLDDTIEDPAPDPIHDLRVAIRRFTQVLTTFSGWFDEQKVHTARRQLKTLFSNAGAVRDYDIVIDLLGKSGVDEVARVADELHIRRKSAERLLMASMHGLVRHNAPSQWHAILAESHAPPEDAGLAWDDLARRELPPRAEKFFKAGYRSQKTARARDLHKLRIAAKKFRYTFELFESAFGPTAQTRLENLRNVQGALGNINDFRSARKLIDKLGGGRKLNSILRKKQHKRIAEFRSLWEAQFPASEIDEWMEFLRRPPRKPVMQSKGVLTTMRVRSAAR